MSIKLLRQVATSHCHHFSFLQRLFRCNGHKNIRALPASVIDFGCDKAARLPPVTKRQKATFEPVAGGRLGMKLVSREGGGGGLCCGS